MHIFKNNIFSILLFVFIFFFAILSRWSGGFADDAAFFLKYADNFSKGYFWTWNINEDPIWGASAPLFPLLISIPIVFGIESISALLTVSILFGVMAFVLTALYFYRSTNYFYSLIFIFLAISDSHLMWYSGTSGLESPLTIFLISSVVFILFYEKQLVKYHFKYFNLFEFLLAFTTALLAINKLDLLPIAFSIFFINWFFDKKFQLKIFMLFLLLTISWYFFAYIYFGSPFPNSFATKAFFQDQPKVIDWKWFSYFVFIDNRNFLLTPFIFFSFIFFDKYNIHQKKITLFLLLIICIHTIAYSIKYPFEPYTWYAMPSFFASKILITHGLFNFYSVIVKIKRFKISILRYVILLFLFFIFLSFSNEQVKVAKSIKHYITFEKDRVSTGKWVSKNTPKDFNVFTYWGNCAYFSDRNVIDGSFLNRKFEKGDIIYKYQPDVLIVDPGYRQNYTLVKIIDEAKKIGVDYPFGIHIRNDLVSQTINTDKNLLSCFKNNSCVNLYDPLINFVSVIKIGEKYGSVSQTKNKDTIFIHPGLNDKTIIEIDFNQYLSKFHHPDDTKKITLKIFISDQISLNEINNEGGNILFNLYKNNKVIVKEQLIDFYNPLEIVIDVNKENKYSIEVDPNGKPNSDWLNLKVIL
jgi:hypothetical protein